MLKHLLTAEVLHLEVLRVCIAGCLESSERGKKTTEGSSRVLKEKRFDVIMPPFIGSPQRDVKKCQKIPCACWFGSGKKLLFASARGQRVALLMQKALK